MIDRNFLPVPNLSSHTKYQETNPTPSSFRKTDGRRVATTITNLKFPPSRPNSALYVSPKHQACSPHATLAGETESMIADLLAQESGCSTGPRTPEGKAVSSLNATTHGLCSNTIVLPGESQAEWEALRAMWISEFGHPNPVVISLAEQTARAEWFFNRATKRYNEAEQALYLEQPDPVRWTEEQHKLLERFQRYRTTHERAFQRALNMLTRMEDVYCKAAADLVKNAATLAEAEKVRKELDAKEEKLNRAPNPAHPTSSDIEHEPDLPLLPLPAPSALPVHDGPDYPL